MLYRCSDLPMSTSKAVSTIEAHFGHESAPDYANLFYGIISSADLDLRQTSELFVQLSLRADDKSHVR